VRKRVETSSSGADPTEGAGAEGFSAALPVVAGVAPKRRSP
jgi:hypothetical protein